MPASARSDRRKSVAALLEVPSSGAWAVCLAYVGGGSDKEYRIVVDGSRAICNWGRTGAGGEIQDIRADSLAAARNEALKRWSAKEAKGYWPVTGVMTLETGPSWLRQTRAVLGGIFGDRVREFGSARPGEAVRSA